MVIRTRTKNYRVPDNFGSGFWLPNNLNISNPFFADLPLLVADLSTCRWTIRVFGVADLPLLAAVARDWRGVDSRRE